MLATCMKSTNVNNEIKGGRKAISPTSHAPEAESELTFWRGEVGGEKMTQLLMPALPRLAS